MTEVTASKEKVVIYEFAFNPFIIMNCPVHINIICAAFSPFFKKR